MQRPTHHHVRLELYGNGIFTNGHSRSFWPKIIVVVMQAKLRSAVGGGNGMRFGNGKTWWPGKAVNKASTPVIPPTFAPTSNEGTSNTARDS